MKTTTKKQASASKHKSNKRDQKRVDKQLDKEDMNKENDIT